MAKFRDPKVRIASQYAKQRRTIRRPSHPFYISQQPFAITPFVISPVIPGETLKNCLVQSRAVTHPIKHPLIGWWMEYFLFYVRLVDLEHHVGAEDFREMLLNPAKDMSSYEEALDVGTYNPAGGINFTQLCLETVTEWYFRDDGEDWDVATLNGYPLAQISGRNWMDSLTLEPDLRADRDVNVDLNDDGDITAREIMEAQQQWHAIREAGLEDMDYEDYVRTYGIQIREADPSPRLYRPELLRYSRDWQYPTNIVDPTSGVPSSAVSWASAFRADKDRFFKEPGFLFGVSVARPKIYVSQQRGSLAHMMKSVFQWLPAVLSDQYEKGFLKVPADEGPLPNIFEVPAVDPEDPDVPVPYNVDIRDLFTYGDQFTNVDPTTQAGFLPLVTEDGKRRYPSSTAIDGLFAAGSPSASNARIRQDGIVTLAIAGRIKDQTPKGVAI